jgi:DNA-binding response OmpR family regulator
MDLRMPVMDGYEATRRIKAEEGGQQTIIVALTASAFEEDRQVLEIGCDDFVRKPFHQTVLFETLARHLDMRYTYCWRTGRQEPGADLGRPGDTPARDADTAAGGSIHRGRWRHPAAVAGHAG